MHRTQQKLQADGQQMEYTQPVLVAPRPVSPGVAPSRTPSRPRLPQACSDKAADQWPWSGDSTRNCAALQRARSARSQVVVAQPRRAQLPVPRHQLSEPETGGDTALESLPLRSHSEPEPAPPTTDATSGRREPRLPGLALSVAPAGAPAPAPRLPGLTPRGGPPSRTAAPAAAAKLVPKKQQSEREALLTLKIEELQLEARVPIILSPSKFVPAKADVHAVEIVGPESLLRRLASLGVNETLRTYLSPLSPVNLPKEELVKAQIPMGTAFFAFFYPVYAAANVGLDGYVAIESLLVNGGFVYFDPSGKILGVNVICPEGSAGVLNFDGPFLLGAEAQHELTSQGRMQQVTLDFLRKKSAESFAWIHPGEFGEGLGQQPAKFGAFAYTSGRNGGGEGIYFPMVIAPKVGLTRRDSTGRSRAAVFLKKGERDDLEEGSEGRARRLMAALLMASDEGDVEVVSRVLNKGVDINQQDDDGYTALIRAAEGGHTSLVKLLVRKGADVWLQNKRGMTALDAAIDRARGDKGRSECFEAATTLIAPAFRTAAGQALGQAVSISAAAMASARLMKQQNTEQFDKLVVASHHAQLSATALLRTLEAEELELLLSTRRGEGAMRDAVTHECKLLLGDGGVQALLRRRWRGSLIEGLVTGEVQAPWGASVALGPSNYSLQLLLVALLLPANLLLLLPLVTVCPPLEDWIVRALPKLGSYRKNTVSQRHGFSETYSFYWASLYLLNVPLLRFVLSTLSSLALATGLTLMPPAVDARSVVSSEPPMPPDGAPVLLVWSVASLIAALRNLAIDPTAWRSDPLNYLMLPALVLASAALGSTFLRCFEVGGHAFATREFTPTRMEGLLAIAVALLWMSGGLGLIRLVSSLGPLVLMLFKMLGDVSQWLMLVVVILFGFAASLYVVFKGAAAEGVVERSRALKEGVPRGGGGEADECDQYTFEIGANLGHDMIVLYQSLMGGDTELFCLEQSEHWAVATSLMSVYLMLAVVLLMNMLIAQMSKTFDNVWEAQALEYQFISAQLVLQWAALPPAPPPLSLLGLPYALLKTLRGLCLNRERSRSGRVRLSLTESDDDDFNPSSDQMGSGSWAARHPANELPVSIDEFAMLHLDDAGQEERWRSKLNKRISRLEAQIDTRLDDVMETLRSTLDKLQGDDSFKSS